AHQQEFVMAKAAVKTTAKTASARKAPAAKTTATKATASKASASKGAVKMPAKPAKTSAQKTPAKAATKVAKASAEKVTVLTLRNIAERLSEAHELPKRQANEMLTQMIEMIAKSLKKGEKIRISGLGILQVRKRAARTGRNPQTGEPIKIKASKKIAFRPTKELKEAI
ncbi:HU family DNA-binding protein, partial [Microvirga aerophila]